MWEAMKPLPPVRRTVGFGDGAVMITRAFAREGWFDVAEVYGNRLGKQGGHDAGMPVPLTWG